MGVPTLGCDCAVCASAVVPGSPNRRTRPSIMVSYGGHNVLIDTGPDFHVQAIREGIHSLDAVLYTHSHADHILGLDDIRPYNLKQRALIPIYSTARTQETLRRQFAYIFDEGPTESSLPGVDLRTIDERPFELFGATITPIPANHGSQPVMGFRIGTLAYLTDFSTLPEESKKLLHGLDVFILDALRHRPHPTHSNVEQSLALVAEVKPKLAYFTHICHDLAHEETNAALPANVKLAHDGLKLEARLA